MSSRSASTGVSTRSTRSARCSASRAVLRRRPMPTFIPACGRTLHLAVACVNRIGTAQSTEDEVNALIAMDSLTDEVLTAIEKLRHTLAQGIASGRVKAVSATKVSEDRLFQTHPTSNILSL